MLGCIGELGHGLLSVGFASEVSVAQGINALAGQVSELVVDCNRGVLDLKML